jgi:hypothetical protein
MAGRKCGRKSSSCGGEIAGGPGGRSWWCDACLAAQREAWEREREAVLAARAAYLARAQRGLQGAQGVAGSAGAPGAGEGRVGAPGASGDGSGDGEGRA